MERRISWFWRQTFLVSALGCFEDPRAMPQWTAFSELTEGTFKTKVRLLCSSNSGDTTTAGGQISSFPPPLAQNGLTA